MYEIDLPFEVNLVDKALEKLIMVDLYNVYYEAPIVVTTDDNGYGFYEKKEEKVILKVILEDCKDEDECKKYVKLIEDTLEVKEKATFKKVDDSNWQQEFEAIDLQNGWVIASPSDDVKGKNKINFESQGAFGTGLHETTQDCLRIILDTDFSGKNVLDIGTGSGILTIAAAVKGASEVSALDIRDVTEEVQYNASLNNLNNISVFCGNLVNDELVLPKKYDYIFINIGGSETLDMLPYINKYIKKQGVLLVSGMVDWSYQEVCSKIKDLGYVDLETHKTNEWVTVLFKNINS